MEAAAIATCFVASLGMQPSTDGWTLEFTLSTVPMSYWFYQRNRLQPGDVKLSLTIPSWGLWVVNLLRHDREYHVQWRAKIDVQIEAQQIKYRKLLKWPELPNVEGFPSLVKEIETVLGIQFIPHVDVGARYINLSAGKFDDEKLSGWLAPCADSWGRFMKDSGNALASVRCST